jgi:molybdate transport system substrate-binding protein
MWNRAFLAVAFASCLATGCRKEVESKPLLVAAAADLAFAFPAIAAAFEAKTGQKVTFSFGSTGLLAKQIAEGAPFDLFAAANVSFARDVVKRGACREGSEKLYARGRIVLWTKDGAAPASVAELADERYRKIAIANPEHAPYGRAAEQAMAAAGVLDAIRPRLIFGENVQQTLQYAKSGNAEVGIVALSLAIATEGGRYTLIEETAHDAIDQAMVMCSKDAERAARASELAAFIGSPEGRAVMRRCGFLLPGETATAARDSE